VTIQRRSPGDSPVRGKPIPWATAASPYTLSPFQDERIDGPIFLDCAGADNIWPSCPMAQAIEHRLHTHHFRHAITLLDYPNAGHAVGALIPNETYYSGPLSGLQPDSNNKAAATGWPKLLQFLSTFARSP